MTTPPSDDRSAAEGPPPATRPVPDPGDRAAEDATDHGDFGGARREGESQGPALSQRIGPYRLLEVIGEGGMGTVYLAEQREPIRRQVAIKVIRSSVVSSRTAHRFQAERQALARMSHPCIAQVYEAGDTESGQPFFAMEHVPGEPITGYCEREGLTIDQRLDLFVAVCRGIHHAHQKGILHRDIKPGNILVATEQGRPVPKIIDFGVAKTLGQESEMATLTAHGTVVGTPSYLSPELLDARDQPADPDTRSDVYSLGVLLFELLVGERPFGRDGDSLVQILREVAEGEVQAPRLRWKSLDPETRAKRAAQLGASVAEIGRRLRGDLDWITLKAAARDRELRYDSAADLAADVERHRRFEPVEAGPPDRRYLVGKFVRRHRGAVIGAALVVSALAAGVVARTLEAERANREAAAARQAQAETQQVVDFMVELFAMNDPGTARGDTVTARELLDRGAGEIRERLADQPLARARLLDTIGLVYRQLDLPEPAKPLFEEALAIRERLHGPDSPEVAASLSQLGDLYWIAGDYAASEAALQRALSIREAIYGADHVEVAEILSHLGSVYRSQARFEAAERLLRRALAIRERALGPGALPVADSLDDVGVSLIDQGDAAGAEPPLRRALQIREAELGPDHPEVASSANGLAISLCLQQRYQECLALMEQALAIREKVFGLDGAPVAQTLVNLSNPYLDLGRVAEAESALVRAAEIWERTLGPEHPRLGIVLNNLGDLHLGRGEPARAEAAFRRASAVMEAGLGREHPNLAYALKGLADSLRALGRDAEAREPCRRAAAIREAALGADDPLSRSTREDCAGWAEDAGQ